MTAFASDVALFLIGGAWLVSWILGAASVSPRRAIAWTAGAGTALWSTLALATPAPMGTALAALATFMTAAFGSFAASRLMAATIRRPLSAALGAVALGLVLTIGPFLLGPALDDLSPAAVRGLLFLNPWVMTASAAGIDVLHLDWVYHLSPLAHRGVALPHWTAACAVYAVFGLACHGAARWFPLEHTTR